MPDDDENHAEPRLSAHTHPGPGGAASTALSLAICCQATHPFACLILTAGRVTTLQLDQYLGYQGSSSLLVRYITQGRVEADRPHLSPRRVTRLLLTRPGALSDSQQTLLAGLTAACPEMTSLTALIGSFAALLKPEPANEARLGDWAETARASDLPNVHAFARGLDLDIDAAIAAVTLPFHNGRTEGVNTKTKMIKRQMYGRAGFALLRHRILLG